MEKQERKGENEMLVLIRLSPKGGLNKLCNAIESGRRNLYWRDVEPLYAIRQEGKRYISILLRVKSIDTVNKVFLKNITTLTNVRKTETIPIMSPAYLPMPSGHPKNLERHLVYLRVAPDHYKQVYEKLLHTKNSKDTFLKYISYSFGTDDIILSILTKDRETAQDYIDKKVRSIEGVVSVDTSKVVRSVALLPEDKLKAHKERFMMSAPAGRNPKRADQEAYDHYLAEKSWMTVFVRLHAKKGMPVLWKDVEENIPKYDTDLLTPLYASQQEDKSYITVIFEAANFEVLKDFLVDDLHTLEAVKKTRTVPLLEPTYFMLPKEHPRNLYRFLVSVRGEPAEYLAIRQRIISSDLPENVFPTYLSYSLGEDDLLISFLSDSRRSVEACTADVLDKMEGVKSYDVSNQLKTMRLTTKAKWRKHQKRFMSTFDSEYKERYDSRYDWTDDFETYAAITGAFIREFEE